MRKFAALIILGLMFLSLAVGQVPPALSAPIAVPVAAIISPLPMMVFQRVGLWENSRIILPVAGLSLLTMLLTLL